MKVDVSDHPLFPGDVLLLASDGLNKMVSDAEVARVLAEDSDPDKAVNRLIEMSRAAGGVDNITVIVARVPAKGQGLKGLVSKLFGGA